MASTQKKTTKKKKAPPKPEPPAYNGLARLIGGVVCLLLALCVLSRPYNRHKNFQIRRVKGTYTALLFFRIPQNMVHIY